ncbi:uncharacterized protein LOC144798085 [Lissotriton helveticus]
MHHLDCWIDTDATLCCTQHFAVAIKIKALNELAAKHSNLKVIQLEATDPESVSKAAKEVEAHLNGAGLNVLINNAGILTPCSIENVDAEDMLHVYSTNVVGPLLVVKAFLHLLKKAAKDNNEAGMSCSKAAVINMSAGLASITVCQETYDFIPVVSYRCSKTALNMLTKCQALGYTSDGVLCTAIHPGWVQTDLGGPNIISLIIVQTFHPKFFQRPDDSQIPAGKSVTLRITDSRRFYSWRFGFKVLI